MTGGIYEIKKMSKFNFTLMIKILKVYISTNKYFIIKKQE